MNQQSRPQNHIEEFRLESPEATQALAQKLAKQLIPGDIIFLEGNLGTGKTFFSQALVKAMGYSGKVLSPTYSLVNSYEVNTLHTADTPPSAQINTEDQVHENKNSVRLRLHHFDLYRLAHPEELEFIGIRDYLTGQDICLIEWPSKGEGILPPATIHISLAYLKDHAEGRIAKITYDSD